MPTRVNLGCGTDIRSGWVNLDSAPLPGVDVVHAIGDGPLPFADESVDEVLAKDVLEHVELIPAMQELHRVLRPGGRLLVTVPFHGRVKAALIAFARFDEHFDPLGQHLRFYTASSLASTLRASGFEEVRVRAWGAPLLRTGLTGWARRP